MRSMKKPVRMAVIAIWPLTNIPTQFFYRTVTGNNNRASCVMRINELEEQMDFISIHYLIAKFIQFNRFVPIFEQEIVSVYRIKILQALCLNHECEHMAHQQCCLVYVYGVYNKRFPGRGC